MIIPTLSEPPVRTLRVTNSEFGKCNRFGNRDVNGKELNVRTTNANNEYC